MTKTTVKIDGMMCSMCEAHISDTIRKIFPDAKKVSASHSKGLATFVTDVAPEQGELKAAIDETGYTFVSMTSEAWEEKGLFSLFRR